MKNLDISEKKSSKEELANLSKVELIDSALLNAVSGAGCDIWVETCGDENSDWCGHWKPKPNDEFCKGGF